MIKRRIKNGIILSAISVFFFTALGLILFFQSKEMRIVKVNYEETAKLGYTVYLNDQKYYNADHLGEDMQYISSLIKEIEIKYDYDIKYSEKVNSTFSNFVTANLKIVDVTNNQNVIYEKNEDIKKETQTKTGVDDLAVDQTIKIDYNTYNSFANEFKTKYGISAGCKLVVTFNTVQNNSSNTIKEINRNREMTVEIPLSEQMITIDKSSDVNEKSSYVDTTSKNTTNSILFILSIVSFVIGFGFVILLIILIDKKNRINGKFNRYVAKLLKKYDSYITESKGALDLNENTIYTKNFKELLDVRNNINKAIVFNRENDKTVYFVIIDENQTYCYVAKKKDFE